MARSRCSGFVQVAGPFLLITYGQRWIPSSLAAILVAAAPIWVALIAPIMNREEIVRGWAAVGVVVGISASCSCSASTSPVRASSRSAARWCCSQPRLRDRRDLGAARLRRRPGRRGRRRNDDRRDGRDAAAGARHPASATPTWHAAALLVLGIGGTGIAFYVFYWLIAEVGASRASVVAYLAPGLRSPTERSSSARRSRRRTLAGLALILGLVIAAEGRAPGPSRAGRAARAERRGPAQPKWTFPFERART